MNTKVSPQTLLNASLLLTREFGPDLSVRQLATLLTVVLAGTSGTDAASVEKRTLSSQAATSRTLKMLSQGHGMVEFFLDPNDGRFRLCRATVKGLKFTDKLLEALAP